MDLEDSIVVREFTRRINDALSKGQLLEEVDLVGIENAILRDSDIIPAALRDEVKTALAATVSKRQQRERELSDKLSRVWGSAFDALDNCTAFAEFLCFRLFFLTVRRNDVIKSKDPRPRPGTLESVTGAPLKCINLISLLARSCCIASEISHLLRRGFLGGAESRLRSLHEQTVVITLLSNDPTYELVERYQDHACYEVLKQLRVYKHVYSEPIWRDKPGEDELTQQITDAEQDVREARLRWGSEIGEQYGWARPAIAGGGNRRRQITFSDLEKAAGADFLRGDYLTQNHQVHAGSYATINHLMTNRLKTAGYRDDETIWITGMRVIPYLHFSSQTISMAISKETEEYDELLYSCEMNRTAEMAEGKFRECYENCSTS